MIENRISAYNGGNPSLLSQQWKRDSFFGLHLHNLPPHLHSCIVGKISCHNPRHLWVIDTNPHQHQMHTTHWRQHIDSALQCQEFSTQYQNILMVLFFSPLICFFFMPQRKCVHLILEKIKRSFLGWAMRCGMLGWLADHRNTGTQIFSWGMLCLNIIRLQDTRDLQRGEENVFIEFPSSLILNHSIKIIASKEFWENCRHTYAYIENSLWSGEGFQVSTTLKWSLRYFLTISRWAACLKANSRIFSPDLILTFSSSSLKTLG